ncbi:hypothetical protein BDZ94DRAFT_313814 [Collybia nuda]|uniref:Uncharacterized protein n=1 Tax=Collybia nuda TaxID=64659 RepID=A0A9P5XTP1_9AGAR|nr:hypothetical protein BDZ94DRAFT_313814 [Collybia nuda]
MSAHLHPSRRRTPQNESGAKPSTAIPVIKLEEENIPPLIPSKATSERVKRAEARLQALLDDEWARDVTTTQVICGGCQKALKLNKQTLYESGSWKRHRSTCPKIAEAEGRVLTKGRGGAKGRGKAQQTTQVKQEPVEPTKSALKRPFVAPPLLHSKWYDAAWEDKEMILVSAREFDMSYARAEPGPSFEASAQMDVDSQNSPSSTRFWPHT